MNFAAGIGAAGSFASGFIKGKQDMEDREFQRQKMALENERMGLEVKRYKDEDAMKAEIKAISEKPAIAKVTTVTGPDGTAVAYTDPKLATQAIAAAGDSAQVTEGFSAGGKMFASKEEAEHTIEAMHTPAAVARRQADIAAKYVNPQAAAMYMEKYKSEVATAKRDIQESFLDAYKRGDIEGAASMFSDRLSNGEHAQVVKGENGAFAIVKTKNGQPVGEPQTFKSPEEFWNGDGTKPGLLQRLATTPDNVAEMWKANVGLKLQERQVASQEKQTDANVGKVNKEVGLMDKEMAVKERMAKASETSAGASATSAQAAVTNAGTGRLGLTKPQLVSGVNPANEVMMTQATPTLDHQGNWGLQVAKPQTFPGMMPGSVAPTLAKPNILSQLGNPGGQAAPLSIDWSQVPQKPPAPITAAQQKK